MRMLIPVAVAFFVVVGTAPAFAEVVIEPLPGSATAGCEQTELGCYNYPVLRVNPGTEITFLNSDNAAHTLTSGSSADGPTGVFASSLVMTGSWYKFTLEEEGTYEHYCLVHPWMTGQIIVGSETTPVEDAPAPTPTPTPPTPAPPPSTPSRMGVVIEPLPGSATAGCEQTEEGCYNIPILTVAPGTTITFSNTDNAAHTLTSGSPAEGMTGVFDSGLVMVGSWYKFTLEEEGTYEHYCLVHPWMTGQIIVGSETTPVENAPAPAPAPPPSTPSSMENRIKALEAMIEELKDMIEKLAKRVDAMAASTTETTPPPEPSSVPSSDSPFYIQVDGTSYSLGDRIGFSGQLPVACPPTVYNVDDAVRERALAYISLIHEPSGDLIRFGQLTCDADMEEFSFIEKVPLDTNGSFDDSWQVDNEFPRGEYRVKIKPTLDRIFDYKEFYSEQFSIQ